MPGCWPGVTLIGEPGCQGSLLALFMISSLELEPDVPGTSLPNSDLPLVSPFWHPVQTIRLRIMTEAMRRRDFEVMMAVYDQAGANKSSVRRERCDL